MKDLYLVECDNCGFQISILLEEVPIDVTEFICDSCKALARWY